MTITGDYLITFLVLLALGLTIIANRIGIILFRMAAAVSWLTLGILFWTNQLGTSLGSPWVQAVSLVFLVMAVGVLSLQMRTDIRHEAQVRGSLGTPGARTESWTTWGPKQKKKALTTMERQANYKKKLRGGV